MKRSRRERDEEEEEEEKDEEDDHFEDDDTDDKLSSTKRQKQRNVKKDDLLRGAIKSVEVENFLIHSNMAVDFNPHVNFISGANGAGKSSILTAIVVGLGARASQTNRSDGNISSLIKYGATSAMIRISLYNEGADAYQPHQYGNKIIVERRLLRNNSTKYRLLNAELKCISEKKVDLDAILDHFGIVPESPIMILNQDAAKTFLQRSTDQNKFLLFHEGTLLTKWQADLKIVTGKVASMKNLTRIKEAELEPLKKAFEKLDERLQEHNESRKDDERAQGVQHEMFWALVARFENEVDDLRGKLKIEQRRLRRNQDEADKCQNDAVCAQEEVDKLQNQVVAKAETKKEAEARRTQKANIYKELEQRYHAAKANSRELNEEIEAKRKNIIDLETKIIEGRSRLDEDRKRQLDVLNIRIQQEQETENRATAEQEATGHDIFNMQREMEVLSKKCRTLDDEIDILKKEEMRIQSEVQELQSRKRSKVAAWGRNMEKVVNQIEDYAQRSRWIAGKPVGPLGQYVEVLSEAFDLYAKVIDLDLGKNLSSFIVWSDADRILLKREIFQQCQAHFQIIIGKRDLDRNRIEVPAGNFRTIERCLKITNPDVYDALIRNTRFEQTILVRNLSEGQALARSYPSNCSKILTAQNAVVGDKRFGGRNVQYRAPVDGLPARFAVDVEPGIREAQVRLQAIRDQIAKNQGDKRTLNIQNSQLNNGILTLRCKETDLNCKINETRRNINQAKESREALAHVDSIDYETEKEVEEQYLHGILAQLEPLVDTLAATKSEADKINESMQEDSRAIQTARNEMEDLKIQLENILLRHADAERNHRAWLQKCEQCQKIIEECHELVSHHDNERRQAETVAQRTCARMELTKTYDELHQELNEIDKRRRQRNEHLGDIDLMKLVDERNAAMKKYETSKIAVAQMKNFSKLMHQSLELRQTLLRKTTKHYRSQFKTTFARLTSRRGYRGRIKIKEEDGGTMDIRVEKENDQGGGKSKRAVNTLSGGEKSYSTLCFLMALWELMDAPFYALDEFDVFMDDVNRSQSIQLLTEASRPASGKTMQLILISPKGSFAIPTQHKQFCNLIEFQEPERGVAAEVTADYE